MRERVGLSLFATAVVASAAAHALVLAMVCGVRVGPATGSGEVQEMAVVFDTPAARNPDELDIGRANAKGYGTHASDGAREQVAREAPQDQPSLSLDPIGDSPVVQVPSMPAGPARADLPVLPRVQLVAVLHRISDSLKELASDISDDAAAQPAEPLPPAPLTAPAGPVTPPSPARGSGADAAPQSDSEVDAFSVLGSADFRDGRVTVRSGRQVKTRRPKIRLAGVVDLSDRVTAQVVLKVAVDATGKVTNVDVIKSSGSNEVDQPCRVAMYDWWFEPKKDTAGRAVADVFQFTISFR